MRNTSYLLSNSTNYIVFQSSLRYAKKSMHHHSANYISYFLWDHWAYCDIFENEVLVMYALEGVSSVANFILFMKSLNKNRDSRFLILGCSLFPKAIFLTFISLHRSWCCRVAAVERLPVHHLSADCISFPLGSLNLLWYLKMEFCSCMHKRT